MLLLVEELLELPGVLQFDAVHAKKELGKADYHHYSDYENDC
jgi:hypothetical protein